MLRKISSIKSFGIFNDFNWDKEVLNKVGAVQSFVDINIIYGRNYSGKTTLSRILRALETGHISDKYENPIFDLKFSDNTKITQQDLRAHGKKVRVFNEDFIRDNLRFITNPDDSIEPFAILGDDNNKIEREIEELETALGSKEEGKETGLFSQKKEAFVIYNQSLTAHKEAEESFEKQLGKKATNTEIGIRYKPERFGDQNYNIQKLKADIASVKSPKYQPLSDEQLTQHETLILEKVLPDVPALKLPSLSFEALVAETDMLITKKISASDKIEDLVKSAVLNRWVNEGRSLHKNQHEKCAFCDSSISKERWSALDRHFDEESEQLEKDIDALIEKPDQGMSEQTLKLFFGGDKIPAVLTDRINNEYSHLCGVFERGAMPIELPEMQTAAWQIIERLKVDSDQYSALLKSVGEQAKESDK